MNLKITRSSTLKPHPLDEDKLGFGQYFTDHMLIQRYDESAGGWQPAEIRPYGLIDLEPASACLHYSQIVWEGMKCYRTANGLKLFRPRENFHRLNRSADRMCMPQVDVENLLFTLKELLKIDQEWVPRSSHASLYIRPCMVASEAFLGLHRAHRYLLFIILSPSGPYFRQGFNPIKILVESKYVRAVRGGTGDVKTPGNYGASLRSVEEAMEQGYSQTLWLDAIDRKSIEEVGAMNIAFVKQTGDRKELITPALSGSILAGITRKSVIELCLYLKIPVTERSISIDEIIDGIQAGTVTEALGLGTAAIVAPIGVINYNGCEYTINQNQVGDITKRLYDNLLGIQYGLKPDPFGWVESVD